MGQNRRPGSGTQQQPMPRAPNGIIAPTGMDMASIPGNAAVALKLEAVKKAMQRKSDTPPPFDRQQSPAVSRGESAARASEGREGSPKETEAQRRKREEKLLQDATAVRSVRALLSLAFQRPHPEPAQSPGHHDFVLQEMRWLAKDFGQERLWKRTAARTFAHAAAAAAQEGGLRATPLGDQMRADAAKAAAQEESSKSRKERMSSNRSAGPSGIDTTFSSLDTNGSLHTPMSFSDVRLTYKARDDMPEVLERHITELSEADIIIQLQEEREWEEEVEAARRAAAEAAEVKRQEREAAEEAADGATTVDEEDQPLGLKNKRRKKGRLAPHILEDYVELDDVADVETPLGRRLGGPGRRPTSSLRPTSGLSDRQLSDAEQRVRKRRRRDLDDEDYEEQIQPRRVSARKASQAAASLDRNRSLLRGAPDKRGAAAGPATKKAVNRMESMGYGMGRRASGAAGGGQSIPWSAEEERLLCAIVHEFGSNWYLVADVLAASCSMQGIYRSPGNCRYRFRAITTSGQGDAEPTEESALAAMQIDKMSARQLLHQSLPVPNDVLSVHQRALANVGQKARQNRQQEEMRARSAAMQRQEPHPSYGLVVTGVLATGKGTYRTPMELADMAEAAASAQAAQAAAAQAAAQAASLPPQPGVPMAPGLAGPPIAGAMSPAQAFPPAMPPMQPPGVGLAPPGQPPQSPVAPGPAGQLPGGAPGAEQLPHMPGAAGLQPGAPPPPQQQAAQQQPPPPPAAAGAVNLLNGGAPPPSVTTAQTMSPAQLMPPAAQNGGLPLGAGSPASMSFQGAMPSAPGTPVSSQQMQQQQVQQQQQQRGALNSQQQQQMQMQQIQQILRANVLPDGRELTPAFRQALIQRMNSQRQQIQPRAGMPPGMQPGMQAAQGMQMQAAQNLVAQQQAAAAARMQQSMAQGQQPMQPQPQQQHPGTPVGGLPPQQQQQQQMPPGMLQGMRPPAGSFGLPGSGPLGSGQLGSGPPVLMAAGQPRPPQGGLPPLAPGQMIAGGMPPPQMAGANIGNLPSLLSQATAAAKPPGTN